MVLAVQDRQPWGGPGWPQQPDSEAAPWTPHVIPVDCGAVQAGLSAFMAAAIAVTSVQAAPFETGTGMAPLGAHTSPVASTFQQALPQGQLTAMIIVHEESV